MWARALTVVLGVWLMAAPAVLGLTGAARVDALVVGPLVASVGVIAASEITRPLRWAGLALGAWLVVAAVALPHALLAALAIAGSGAAVAALALVRGRIEQRTGGGWASLWTA